MSTQINTEIIVTDYTAFKDERICLAGINHEGIVFRLLPYQTHANHLQKNINLGTKLNITGNFVNNSQPHVEDFVFSSCETITSNNKNELLTVLQNSCVDSLISVFGSITNKSIDNPKESPCSLTTISLHPSNISAVRCQYSSKVKVHIKLSDYESYKFLSLRDYHYFNNTTEKNVDAKVQDINNRINSSKIIYMRAGITRESDGKFWLQLNNIFFF